LAKVKKDIGVLETFYNDTNKQWGDIARRNIGHVDWAPEIYVDVEGRHYTKDIGTFQVDAARFKDQFKGNVVNLSAFCLIFLIITSSNKNNLQETSLLPSNSPTCSTLKVPVGRRSSAPRIASSGSTVGSRASSWLIVMKDGNTTDLTVGRYAGLEAYLCDELGRVESTELAIYNYDKQYGPFSAKGDSGSLTRSSSMARVIWSEYGRNSPFWDAERREQPRHLRHPRLVGHLATQTQVSAWHADFNRIAF
jgi:hypothetical protein